MARRIALVLAIAAIAVLAIGTWLRMRDRSATPQPASDSPTVAAGSGKPSVARNRSSADAPSLPANPEATGREYTVGGVRIRDHRSGDNAPIDLPPAVHPPDGPRVAPQLSSELGQRVRAAMSACAAKLPASSRSDTARMAGTVQISIKDRKATVTQATVQLRDVEPAAAAPVKQCIEDSAVGLTIAANDSPDVEDYMITLSFRLR